MAIDKHKINIMIEMARKAMKNAFVPVTNHGVGASVLTKSGHIFIGCNVQSHISGLGTCAERSSIDNAVAHGEYDVMAICVVSKNRLYP